jgi:hypothetical protein
MRPYFRRLAAVLASAAAMTVASGSLPLIAQEPGNAPAQVRVRTPGKRVFDPTRRVPRYFGQLGLSGAQKESIYKIQAKHQPKIDELQKQLLELRAQTVKECETVLTDSQKKMLEDRRAGAAEARARRTGVAGAGAGAGAGAAAKPQG